MHLKKTLYAQHNEDAQIAELLGFSFHSGRPNITRPVFYIDIGAWDPNVDSVTKVFYEAGGCGINVEPVPEYAERLQRERPRDVNLQVAIGERSEMRTFTHIKETGLSTFHEENAKNGSNGREIERFEVPTLTLEALCRIYVPKGREIDFLKIDVEGWEREVIVGGDWATYRPRIVVVEATVPGTDTPAWDTWDYLMIEENGYDFLSFDGLNRWYEREESDSTSR